MSFNEECDNLDRNQMSRPVKYNRTTQGIEPVVGAIHHVCQSIDNPDEWVSVCPDNCSFFLQK